MINDGLLDDVLDSMLTSDKVITALLASLKREVQPGAYAYVLNEPGVGSDLMRTSPPAFFDPSMN